MDDQRIELELGQFLKAEVEAVEPAGWWNDTVARATERRKQSRWYEIASRHKWMRPSLVAVPAALVIVALLIIQPWAAPIPGFSEALAKSYIAAKALQSYRTELTLTQSAASGGKNTVVELAYSAPDSYHTKKREDGTVDETIKIGDQTFYRTLIDGTVPEVVSPDSSGLAPDMGKMFSLLNTLHGLKTMGVKTVDGVRCYGYRGNLYLPSGIVQGVDVWIGQDDNLPRSQTMGNGYNVRFFDFNQAISIEPPLTAAGVLQEGWHYLQTGPHLSVNWSNSIRGMDHTHSVVKYDITVSNDGLQAAKGVRITLETPATSSSKGPQVLEVSPPGGIVPVDIPSWQSFTYQIEWAFDSGDMSKAGIVQLVQQAVITITFHTEDGTEITQTLRAK